MEEGAATGRGDEQEPPAPHDAGKEKTTGSDDPDRSRERLPGGVGDAHRRIPWAWLVAVVLVAVVAGAIGWMQHAYRRALGPVAPGSGTPVVVTIPSGSSTLQIARLLEERRLIRSAWAFRLLAWQKGQDDALKAGVYRLHRGMSAPMILDQLVRGEVLHARFTIPEGWTVGQAVQRLVSMGLAERAPLEAALAEAARRWPFLPDGVPLAQPLEGYLFPDTYHVPVDEHGRATDPGLLVGVMLDRFRQVFDSERQRRAREMGLTVHQVVTLASIVEREARVADEKPLIAAVYLNRLRRGMSLDADPTVLYALGRLSGPLTRSDLRVESPYNTYRVAGLPPGPIGSPGRDALDAVLNPADVDYLFFVLAPDGSGRHRFARTLAEHERNVRDYRAAQGAAR